MQTLKYWKREHTNLFLQKLDELSWSYKIKLAKCYRSILPASSCPFQITAVCNCKHVNNSSEINSSHLPELRYT